MTTLQFFLTLILSTSIPQLIKVILSIIRKEKKNLFEVFMETGGMPSSHAGLVSSMTTLIYLMEGFSALFFISLTLAFIVMRDAFGVRLASGNQAKIINVLIEQENKRLKKTGIKTSKSIEPVKIVKGHTIKEVSVGAIIGIAITLVIYFI